MLKGRGIYPPSSVLSAVVGFKTLNDFKKNPIIVLDKRILTDFPQKGFHRTVISDIARMSGIGKGGIYEYFPGKEELFFSVFEWMNEEMKQAAKVGISALGDRFQETFRTMYADYRQMVARIITDGMRNGEFKRGTDPTAVAAALVGSWDALGLQARLDPHLDLKTISHTFLDVVIEGLQT